MIILHLVKRWENIGEKLMRILVKLILMIAIGMFGLINLRVYSFNKGFSKFNTGEDMTVTEFISLLTDIKKVEYYSRSFKDDEYKYNVYIKTGGDCYLLKATQEDIDAFSTLGIFSSKLKPQKVAPIPIYVDLIAMFIVLIIPVRKKNYNSIE